MTEKPAKSAKAAKAAKAAKPVKAAKPAKAVKAVKAAKPAKAVKAVKAANKPTTSRKRTTRPRKPSHDEVAERAYFIYVEEGGCDELENWLRAEWELTTA
jgi:hypothetical protein